MAKTTKKAATTAKQAPAKKTTAKAAAKPAAGAPAERDVFGFRMKTWTGGLKRAKGAEARTGKRAMLFAFGSRDKKLIKKIVGPSLQKWQQQQAFDSDGDSQFFQGSAGPVWIFRGPAPQKTGSIALEKSGYARYRDLAGAVVGQLGGYSVDKLVIETHGLGASEERGLVVGFEMASYSFMENRREGGKSRRKLPSLLIKSATSALADKDAQRASQLGLCVNLARHFTNLSGGELNPRTFADAIKNLFAGSTTVVTSVWEGEKLREERMNLLLAVGGAAADGPRLVHLRYRPKAGTGGKPVAIVGKGITFDSGGLDIKPSSGMRLMKKDMGGAAAAVALAKWAELTALPLPLDVYVSLAENAVGAGAFRPGDVIVARSGSSVEIHNTDAEGRLVLADALDVAVGQEGDDKPQAVINIATLTGAIKVGLGAEIAGLFSNSDDVAGEIAECGRELGDLVWRMPLFQPYRSQLKSTFAEMSNCSDGFGGAITAALFLESFVKGVPWAHLDIYAWKDGASGAYGEGGGSGQSVQALSEFLIRASHDHSAEELA